MSESTFAKTIMEQKYSKTKKDGTKETWEDICHRVTKHVMKALGYDAKSLEYKKVLQMMIAKKFVPGGRYLYAAGNQYHQTQNCLLLRAEDSREGWAELMQKATLALMTGAGIGIDYSNIRAEGSIIRKTGGTSTGPIALMQMINEAGRGIMQGGSRRSAIWAGLSWKHKDIHKFITAKNWTDEVRKIKEKDFNFPATLDGTNISVQLDNEFFEAYGNDRHPLHSHAHSVYWATVKQMLSTAEPGFSVDLDNSRRETLRNAPVGPETLVLTSEGYIAVRDIINKEVLLNTGSREVPATFTLTKQNTEVLKVEMSNGKFIVCDPEHEFILDSDKRVKACNLESGYNLKNITGNIIHVVSIIQAGRSDVYCCDVKVSDRSFVAEDVIISNCTELTSEDDSDICNIGSINMAKITSLEDMREVVRYSTLFLLAGTVYSDVPYAKVDMVRSVNRRLGLGLMGLHEWLLINGKVYGPDADLEEYLKIYETSTSISHEYADKHELSRPIKTRAIAPTGTIGIIAETTTGIEPIFCVAYKRRYLKHMTWNYQYVIDPTAKRLINNYDIDPNKIEDAYVLSEDIERRLKFQAFIQKYVDHGISSTINLSPWGSESNNNSTAQEFGTLLLKYLPQLRGVTCYPDGARGGQPLTPVKYHTAVKNEGNEIVEAVTDVCDITKGGSCGS